MATSWKSQQGEGAYSLQFETDSKEKYKLVEKAAQMAVDGKTIDDVVEVRHAEWIEDGYSDSPCVCSYGGEEAQYISTFNETFDYDWEENLQPTGYEEIREYVRTPYCHNCGAKMDGKDE